MSNEMHGKDKEEVKFENKHFNKKISILAGIIVFAVVVSFFGAYIISDRLINPKYSQEKEDDEKTVYNNSKILSDDMMVVLMNEGVVEKEQSILEFKKENSIVSDINQQFVVNFYEANGYNLESLEDDKVVFVNKNKTRKISRHSCKLAIIGKENSCRLSSAGISFLAGAERFELSTRGFGDRCSTS